MLTGVDRTPTVVTTIFVTPKLISKCNLWIRPPSLIIRLPWVDTRVLDFVMILFHIYQQVCRHPAIFACSPEVRAAGECHEAMGKTSTVRKTNFSLLFMLIAMSLG
jgi:hypothetical protein